MEGRRRGQLVVGLGPVAHHSPDCFRLASPKAANSSRISTDLDEDPHRELRGDLSCLDQVIERVGQGSPNPEPTSRHTRTHRVSTASIKHVQDMRSLSAYDEPL